MEYARAGRGAIRSSGAVRSLRTIKRCALVVVGFVVAGLIYIVASGGSDDRAGGVVIGLVLVSAAIAVATAARLQPQAGEAPRIPTVTEMALDQQTAQGRRGKARRGGAGG